MSDFDGTLSPIVADPAEARPLGGVAELLARLARRFGVVAVVSGRPVSFLIDRLTPTGHGPSDDGAGPGGIPAGVRLVGLYGLEWSDEAGAIVRGAGRGAVAVGGRRVSWPRLVSAAPAGVEVEGKGLAVTVHWRQAPEAEPWVTEAVASESARTGLRAHPGRMSIELRPAIDVDKGSVIRRLVQGCSAACYLGDDLGDLPAFAALAELSDGGDGDGRRWPWSTTRVLPRWRRPPTSRCPARRRHWTSWVGWLTGDGPARVTGRRRVGR